MLNHSTQSGRHAHVDRKNDLYETPEGAVRTLLLVENLPKIIWEPACGPGAIVRVLRKAGHLVWATDLVDYGCEDSESGVDFLMEQYGGMPVPVEAIVTNPPYKLADQFVTHALTLVPKVIMLLRLAFLESARRSAILDGGKLARVYVFRNRLPMMHRDGWQGNKASSAVPFAWFVWDHNHHGPTELHRLTFERV